MKHTPGEAPCLGVVGQHKTDSMGFLLVCYFLSHWLFCLLALIFIFLFGRGCVGKEVRRPGKYQGREKYIRSLYTVWKKYEKQNKTKQNKTKQKTKTLACPYWGCCLAGKLKRTWTAITWAYVIQTKRRRPALGDAWRQGKASSDNSITVMFFKTAVINKSLPGQWVRHRNPNR